MKCKNCGNKFEEGIFCPECGTKIEEELSVKDKEDLKKDENEGGELLAEHKAEQEKVIQEQDQLTQEQTEQEQSAEKIEQENEQKKKKKTDRKAIISLVLGILSWVGFASLIMPMVGGIWSIVDGIKALKGKTKYKKVQLLDVCCQFWHGCC